MTIANMPRRIDNVTLLLDEQILDPMFVQTRFEETFFCGCGEAFVISFGSEDEAQAYVAAQCPACTALAPNFPADETDPAISAPDLPGRVSTTKAPCLATVTMIRESVATDTMVDLAVAAA